MDEAAVRKRCEEIAKGWTLTGPGGNCVDYLYYLYRAAYAAGMERAAGMVEDDCYANASVHDPTHTAMCMHNANQAKLATKIRQAAGEGQS